MGVTKFIDSPFSKEFRGSEIKEGNSVATLTFHEAINYGAALQTHALQRTIEKLGYHTEVLNYSCPAIYQAHYGSPTSLKSRIGRLLKLGALKRKHEAFRDFFHKNVKISQSVSRKNLADFSNSYSSVIVGSDQVWNTDLTCGDKTYFLDFLPSEKRRSYAASIGVKSWNKEEESELVNLLANFKAITVRESTAADYLESLLGSRPAVVCDPVFLLSYEEWNEVAVKPTVSEDYVLVYTFGKPPKDCLAWARKQAKDLDCKLVVLHFGTLPIPGAVNVRDAGPAEFLGWIRNARFVISPSFHGCCFSVIFKREFCWFRSNADSAELKSRSSRIEDLLKKFPISNREVNSSSNMPPVIDYGSASKVLDGYRAESLSMLVEVIS